MWRSIPQTPVSDWSTSHGVVREKEWFGATSTVRVSALSRTRKRPLTRRSLDDFVPLTDSRPQRRRRPGRKQRGTRRTDSAGRRSKRGRPGASSRERGKELRDRVRLSSSPGVATAAAAVRAVSPLHCGVGRREQTRDALLRLSWSARHLPSPHYRALSALEF